jgi:phosphinothricin acetyltransferase
VNSESEILIRNGRKEDAQSIADIYNYYITETSITFEIDPVTLENRQEWIQQFTDDGPYQLLVAEQAGQLIGFASSVRYHPRAAYYTSVMPSIYLRDGFSGRGIGKLLYSNLIRRLEANPDNHKAFALISLPNPASLILHEKMGFKKVGILDEAGKKFGKFISVQIMERSL